MIVSILGCGWYGKGLAGALVAEGFTVNGSTTAKEKTGELSAVGIKPYIVQFAPDRESFKPEFFRCDLLVTSVPPKFRKGETEGYLHKMQRVINNIIQNKIQKVIYISSTGVYGDVNKEVSEQDYPLSDTRQGEILLLAEKLFTNEKKFKTTVIRFAGLVGPGRHPGRFFAGKTHIPNGLAPVNLIHLADAIGITLAIIKHDTFGYVINAVSPDHPLKSVFYRNATQQAGLIVPEFIDELISWKVVSSRVIAGLLGYQFKIDEWEGYTFEL